MSGYPPCPRCGEDHYGPCPQPETDLWCGVFDEHIGHAYVMSGEHLWCAGTDADGRLVETAPAPAG